MSKYRIDKFEAQELAGAISDVKINNMLKVKLTKLKEAENPRHPGNIPEGEVHEGEFINHPVVNAQFWVGTGWRTSLVQEILSQDTFRTFNSIYRYEIVNEQ